MDLSKRSDWVDPRKMSVGDFVVIPVEFYMTVVDYGLQERKYQRAIITAVEVAIDPMTREVTDIIGKIDLHPRYPIFVEVSVQTDGNPLTIGPITEMRILKKEPILIDGSVALSMLRIGYGGRIYPHERTVYRVMQHHVPDGVHTFRMSWGVFVHDRAMDTTDIPIDMWTHFGSPLLGRQSNRILVLGTWGEGISTNGTYYGVRVIPDKDSAGAEPIFTVLERARRTPRTFLSDYTLA